MADWQKGDLALTIWNGIWPFEPRRGRIYEVAAVEIGDSGTIGLRIDEVPNDPGFSGWNANGFRKVTPPKADEFDKEVISLMTTNPSKVEA